MRAVGMLIALAVGAIAAHDACFPCEFRNATVGLDGVASIHRQVLEAIGIAADEVTALHDLFRITNEKSVVASARFRHTMGELDRAARLASDYEAKSGELRASEDRLRAAIKDLDEACAELAGYETPEGACNRAWTTVALNIALVALGVVCWCASHVLVPKVHTAPVYGTMS